MPIALGAGGDVSLLSGCRTPVAQIANAAADYSLAGVGPDRIGSLLFKVISCSCSRSSVLTCCTCCCSPAAAASSAAAGCTCCCSPVAASPASAPDCRSPADAGAGEEGSYSRTAATTISAWAGVRHALTMQHHGLKRLAWPHTMLDHAMLSCWTACRLYTVRRLKANSECKLGASLGVHLSL